ncbi:NitT/TauT family transport system ATP-binding protein [Peptoclostridium litorale DSM 5388]|uniref:Putative ABC transporter ATP-binding protein n=1 Tax=Peptoclostridium litorale DSM 5388 TaxID=1121324 RepID=A0A069RGW3_PEPLI|nr:ABC transporter ATP-binding protein SaoA [Peptoclostridium litorale]KDR96274.1 putative ABC transporter ATP-binding protein [Peptoclostridium litorale DSM 5388]SIO14942.1 NitT/TauT family transport system ATP-binding protein [Peptoclostridium litorale DSM 5388]
MNLEVRNIDKTFINNKEENKVLGNIDFKVEKGQFISLLGPSGCGKTTLLTIMAGFQKADSGEILLEGKKVAKPGPDRGFVFQNYALFPWMNLRHNIMFPMKQQGVPKAQREERMLELLRMAQLEGNEKLYPHQMSGGMKQRAAVIRALACKPQVLLMDEPLGAVDFQMRQLLQEELESLVMKANITAVMVTHDVDEAVYMSDRVIVMSRNRGKILSDMSIEMERPRDRKSGIYAKYKDELTAVLKRALDGE